MSQRLHGCCTCSSWGYTIAVLTLVCLTRQKLHIVRMFGFAWQAVRRWGDIAVGSRGKVRYRVSCTLRPTGRRISLTHNNSFRDQVLNAARFLIASCRHVIVRMIGPRSRSLEVCILPQGVRERGRERLQKYTDSDYVMEMMGKSLHRVPNRSNMDLPK